MAEWFLIALFAGTAMVLTAIFIPLACRQAVRMRFVDRPGGRKGHKGAVPPVGGAVIFSIFLPLALLADIDISGFPLFLLALALLAAVGICDDRMNVPAWVKFFMQFATAILAVTGGQAVLLNLGDLFGLGVFWLGFMAVPFSVIATVLLVNAVNLMDGLDGLAGGKSFIALGWLAAGALISGQTAYLLPLGILMGALAGFLMYNLRTPLRKKATVFLGDAGSLGLGLALAWFSIHLAAANQDSRIEPIAVAWILALPIMDTCGQFARRVSEGRHPFDADQDHFHHHFINVGISVHRATATILLLSFLTGMVGIVGTSAGVPLPLLTGSWIILLLLHIYLSMKPHRMRRLIARLPVVGKGVCDD